GLAGLAGFAAIGVAAALTRHEAPLTAALPTLVGALAGGTAFLFLDVRRRGDNRAPDRVAEGPRRREVLTAAGVLIAGATVVGFGGRWIATRRGVSQARAAVDLPAPVDPAPPVPAAADLS